VISGFVARSIMKVRGPQYLTIEHSCRDAIESDCGKRRGKLAQASRPNGRIDLLLWWANDSPRAVVEIKNNVHNYKGQCEADIDRIAKLLLMSNTNFSSDSLFSILQQMTGRLRKPRKS
jgi:hypothetical protein